MTKTVDVFEVQNNLAGILSLIAEGTEVILTSDNKPLARLLPIEASETPRVAGLHEGKIWTSDDFAEPLPDEFWTENS
jgi:antitoxin (DNA-binding transcriptional repressor) of toxin-antitoxin stability system